ncbi:hypothetical protein LCGC14_2082690 [marine sediment metagenome]|uniref:FCP1 homology domain-containing protein n=1 Tax=marine sediment metagenome TaxID=412755 RepID=A0A0F9HC46_9ZZZZ
MRRPMIVAIKLDGVLAFYDRNRGVTEIGRPLEGGQEFCRWLIEECKAKVVVVSGRRREDLVKVWLDINKIQYTAINKQVGDETVQHASEQVIADIYLGNHFVDVEQGHWVPAVHAIQARLAQLIAARDRPSYDW